MKKIKFKFLALLMCFMMTAGLLGGCQTDNTKTNTAAESQSAENTSQADPVQSEERAVTDMADRQVAVPEEINSIATFGSIGVLNAFVELMGEGSKICNNMSPRFTSNDKWAMQYEFAPQMADCPVFEDQSGEIVMEEVLKAEPDLCLCMSKDTADLLEAQGLTVIVLNWSELDDVDTCINLLGEVLNKKEIAEDYLTYFDDTVKKAEDLLKDVPESDRKKVLYGDISSLTQPHSIAEWWIAAAGGISVTDNGRTEESYTYTAEDLLSWNPDVIIASSGKVIEETKANSLYADIPAVQNDKMYAIPTVAHVWGNRTVEQPLTILWTMNKLYPDIMTDEELSKEISYFYEHFFLTSLTDEQIAKIIGNK
ncbi:MAG: ABC transporter substrate-binding protein [Lachnospiraceae bacterium]|nr:ABC transporter substrate-binding protein [Lachnospiraceae bacterium]